MSKRNRRRGSRRRPHRFLPLIRWPAIRMVFSDSRGDYSAKQLAVPQGPFGQLCAPGVPDITDLEWLPLLQMAADFGWPVELPLLR